MFVRARFSAPSTDPAPILPSETTARKLFGSIDVVGRTVVVTKTMNNPEWQHLDGRIISARQTYC